MNSAPPPPVRRAYRQAARAEAAEVTGQRIVEAFLAALRDRWLEDITLDEVARTAGVSVQTVIRRFGGKPGLLEAATAIVDADVRKTRGVPRGDLGTAVVNLCADYEHTGDMIIRLLAQEGRYAALKPFLDHGRKHHRAWVDEVAAPWLAGLSKAAHEAALDALVAALDVYVWRLLRRDMGRSAERTRETILGMAQAVLNGLPSTER